MTGNGSFIDTSSGVILGKERKFEVGIVVTADPESIITSQSAEVEAEEMAPVLFAIPLLPSAVVASHGVVCGVLLLSNSS